MSESRVWLVTVYLQTQPVNKKVKKEAYIMCKWFLFYYVYWNIIENQAFIRNSRPSTWDNIDRLPSSVAWVSFCLWPGSSCTEYTHLACNFR